MFRSRRAIAIISSAMVCLAVAACGSGTDSTTPSSDDIEEVVDRSAALAVASGVAVDALACEPRDVESAVWDDEGSAVLHPTVHLAVESFMSGPDRSESDQLSDVQAFPEHEFVIGRHHYVPLLGGDRVVGLLTTDYRDDGVSVNGTLLCS